MQRKISTRIGFGMLPACVLLLWQCSNLAQTTPPEDPTFTDIKGTLYDLDADAGFANTDFTMTVDRLEEMRGGCLGATVCAPKVAILSSTQAKLHTDAHGAFTWKGHPGAYRLRTAIPGREPIEACIDIIRQEGLVGCSKTEVNSGSELLFIRSAKNLPAFHGDMMTAGGCQQGKPTVCYPLQLKTTLETTKILLLDPAGNPIRNTRLDFTVPSKLQRPFASITTDINGIANLQGLAQSGYARSFNVSFRTELGSAWIELTLPQKATEGIQNVHLMQWHCGAYRWSAYLDPVAKQKATEGIQNVHLMQWHCGAYRWSAYLDPVAK